MRSRSKAKGSFFNCKAGGNVFVGTVLSACLLAKLLKKVWMNIHKFSGGKT